MPPPKSILGRTYLLFWFLWLQFFSLSPLGFLFCLLYGFSSLLKSLLKQTEVWLTSSLCFLSLSHALLQIGKRIWSWLLWFHKGSQLRRIFFLEVLLEFGHQRADILIFVLFFFDFFVRFLVVRVIFLLVSQFHESFKQLCCFLFSLFGFPLLFFLFSPLSLHKHILYVILWLCLLFLDHDVGNIHSYSSNLFNFLFVLQQFIHLNIANDIISCILFYILFIVTLNLDLIELHFQKSNSPGTVLNQWISENF